MEVSDTAVSSPVWVNTVVYAPFPSGTTNSPCRAAAGALQRPGPPGPGPPGPGPCPPRLMSLEPPLVAAKIAAPPNAAMTAATPTAARGWRLDQPRWGRGAPQAGSSGRCSAADGGEVVSEFIGNPFTSDSRN